MTRALSIATIMAGGYLVSVRLVDATGCFPRAVAFLLLCFFVAARATRR